MLMRQILGNYSFSPEVTVVLGEAFDRACETLKSYNSACKETERDLLALRILALARIGEHDPDRLVDRSVAFVTGRFIAPMRHPIALRIKSLSTRSD
jgi:hypothetical protein